MYLMPVHSNYKYKLDMIEMQFPHPYDEYNFYPIFDNIHYDLLDEIAKYVNVSPDSILLTCGSDGALELICNTILTPESNCLILTPTYPQIFNFMSKCNIKTLDINTSNIYILHKYLKNNKIDCCYMCLPNMPLGYIFNITQLTKIIDSNLSTFFIIDEAYYEYGNLVNFSNIVKGRMNIITTRTFSKFFAIPALRIGYLISNDITIFNNTYNSKSVTNIAKTKALELIKNNDWIEKTRQLFEETKTYLITELNKIIHCDDVIYKYNLEYGPYFCIWTKKDVIDIFEKHGVYVRNKDSYIRITIASKESMMYIIKILKFINIKSFIKNSITGFDLDGTLRDGSEGPIKVKLLDNHHIVTNNVHPPQKISREIGVPENKIFSSLENAKNYLLKKNIKVKIFGGGSYFDDIKDNKSDNVLFVEGTSSDVKQFCDCKGNKYTTDVPFENVIHLGKPYINGEPNTTIFVGNEKVDQLYASKINADFILIDFNQKSHIEDDHFIFSSILELFD